MKTFFNILQTITNKKHKTYPDEPFTINDTINNNNNNKFIDEIDYFINKMYFDVKIYTSNPVKSKFFTLNYILNNSFYTNDVKDGIFSIFSKAQNYYNSFSRLALLYKLKKYSTIVTNDLTLNPLDIKKPTTFLLVETKHKSKYLFSLNDLVSIIENAITNSSDFFICPEDPLNPYNKEPLTIATLYNIYFKLKASNRLMSTLFHLFFLENFNKNEFVEKYEYYIREQVIRKYVYNSPHTVLIFPTMHMLHHNKYSNKLIIHKNFPLNTLVDIFRPFLFYYFLIYYSKLSDDRIVNYKHLLFIKLKKFYEFNRSFGKQYCKIIKINEKRKRIVSFNSEHMPFYKIPIYYEINSNGDNDSNTEYSALDDDEDDELEDDDLEDDDLEDDDLEDDDLEDDDLEDDDDLEEEENDDV